MLQYRRIIDNVDFRRAFEGLVRRWPTLGIPASTR